MPVHYDRIAKKAPIVAGLLVVQLSTLMIVDEQIKTNTQHVLVDSSIDDAYIEVADKNMRQLTEVLSEIFSFEIDGTVNPFSAVWVQMLHRTERPSVEELVEQFKMETGLEDIHAHLMFNFYTKYILGQS